MIRPLALLVFGSLLLFPQATAGQVPDSVAVQDSAAVQGSLPTEPVVRPVDVQDSARIQPVSPRSAMFRSFLLPGWGQAKFDAYFRGSIYFAGWAGNWYMNVRNVVRLDEARDRLALRRSQIETALIENSPNPDSMQAQLDSFPDILDTAVDEDELGSSLQGLVRARGQQREDWIAWSLFWLLASGVDAYVTGHLSDFPAEVEIQPNRDQSITLRVDVPLPRRRE